MKDLVRKTEEIKCENIIEHDPNWPQIPDHPYKILIIRIWKNKCII